VLAALAAALAALVTALPAGCDSVPATDPIAGIGSGTPTPEQAARLDAAETAKAAGSYDVALDLFQEILAENPTITVAYVGIGDIYLIKQEYAKAEPAFARAARLEPRNFDAQFGHGVALQLLRRLVDAVRAYQRALTIDPTARRRT
jgi:tetratricopeptide (TPR) repeat protein